MARPSLLAPAAEEQRSDLSSHDRLLLAARTLFSSDGYENTTTSAIARRAGTSESQLIKHFGSKEGLLEAIFDRAWQQMGSSLRQVVERPEPSVARLGALSELMIGALERDRELRTLMLLEGRRIRRHGQVVLLTRGFREIVAAIDRLLAEMQAAGELGPGLGVEAVRSALIGAFEGLLRDQLLAERMGYPAHYGSEELRATFAAVLRGLLAR